MQPEPQATFQTQRIQAISLTVTDLDRSIHFYTKALHFQVISDVTVEEKVSSSSDSSSLEEIALTRIRIVTLSLGDENIRLMQYLDKAGKPIPQDSQSNDLWFQHLAIVVSDMDRAYTHLQSFSITSISTAPQTIPPGNKDAAYIQSFKFKDDDSHPLELIWFPSGKGQEKWHQRHDELFLGIDHTAIAVANTEQSLTFYRDFLGMQVDGGSFNWRETQARMDGLANAKVNITALRPIQGGLGIELLDYIEPANGRPMSPGLKPYDIAYVQIETIVHGMIQTINQSYKRTVKSTPVQSEDDSFSNYQSCRIKDPTGHALLLISEQY